MHNYQPIQLLLYIIKNYLSPIMKLFIGLFFLILLSNSQTPAVWNQDNSVQTGTYELVVGGTFNATYQPSLPMFPPAYSYIIPYSNSVANAPSAALGINSLQFQNITNNIFFFNNRVNSVSLTNMVGVAFFNGTTTFKKIKLSLIVCDQVVNTFLKLRQISWNPDATSIGYFSGLKTGNGYRELKFSVTRSTPIDLSHVNFQLAFIKTFSISAQSTDGRLEMGVRFQNINSATYYTIIWTSGNCQLYYAEYYSITFDQTIVQSSEATFVDSGYILGVNGSQTTYSSMVAQKINNFIVGINYFCLNFTAGQNNLGITIPYPNSISASNYTEVNFTYFNYRVRYCPPSQPYYYKGDQMCYSTCPSGTFFPGGSATYCSPCDQKCALCTSTPNCTSCNSSHFRELNSDLCVCKSGYFDSSSPICGKCAPKCLQCTSLTSCTLCNASQGVFLNSSDQTCTTCGSGCLVCTSLTTCSSCDTSNGYFLNSTDSTCNVCHYSCVTCQDSTTCLSCDINDHRTHNSAANTCECQQGFYDNGVAACVVCAVGCLTCNKTDCQTCDSGYTLSASAPFVCNSDSAPNKNFAFSIVSVIKQPQANNLTYNLILQNMPQELLGTDLSLIFNFGVPPNSVITIEYNSNTGALVARVAYSESLHSLDVNITLDPKNSGLPIFSLSTSTTMNKRIFSANNLAANLYPQSLYDRLPALQGFVKAFLVISLITFLLGMYTGKVIATEMVGLIQVSAVGLTLIHYGSPLLWPFRLLKYAHGLSIPGSYYQVQLPTELTWMSYYNSLSNNLNLMLLLPLISILVAITFLVLSKVIQQATQKQKLWKYFNTFIGEYFLIAIIFCIYQFFVSFPIMIIYEQQSGKMFYTSLVEIILFLIAIGGVVTLFIMKDQTYFGQFKKFFHPDPFCQLYYLIPITERIIIGALMGACRDPFIVGILTMIILAASLIVIAIRRPYIDHKQNARAIANYAVSIIVIAIFVAISGQASLYDTLVQSSLYLPYAVIILLFLMTLTSLGFIIHKLVLEIREMIQNSRRQQTTNLFTTQNQQVQGRDAFKVSKQLSFDNPKDITSEAIMNFEMPKPRRRKRKNPSSSLETRNQTDHNGTVGNLNQDFNQNLEVGDQVEAIYQF